MFLLRVFVFRECLYEISFYSFIGGSVYIFRVVWWELILFMGFSSRELLFGDVFEEMFGVILVDNLEFLG